MAPHLVAVTARATDTDLITLAEVKARQGMETSENDAALQLAIGAASRAVEDYIGRPLTLQSYREVTTADQRGDRILRLARRPVDPSSVTVSLRGTELTSDVTVINGSAGELYRSCGWPVVPAADSAGLTQLEVTYRAGYLAPGAVSDWAAEASIEVGDWVRPGGSSPWLFECTVAGDTGVSSPTWSGASTAGDTVSDGDVTWAAVDLQELPQVLRLCAYLATVHLFVDRPGGLRSWREGDASEAFAAGAHGDLLPVNVQRSLNGWGLR